MTADPYFFVLCLLSSLAGLTMTAGGIWLIYRGKIYIDRETGQATTEVELPLGVKLKTNVPALVLFLVGLVLMLYPIQALLDAQDRQRIELAGKVDGDSFPVEIQAVVSSWSLHEPGRFSLVVPRLAESQKIYRVVYLAGGSVFEDVADLHRLQQGTIALPPKIIQAGSTRRYRPPDSLPPVPAEFDRGGNR